MSEMMESVERLCTVQNLMSSVGKAKDQNLALVTKLLSDSPPNLDEIALSFDSSTEGEGGTKTLRVSTKS